MAGAYLFGVLLHLLLQGSLEAVGAGEQRLHTAILLYEPGCGLLSYARTTGYVVGCIAHECQHVNDLCGPLQPPFGTHLGGSHDHRIGLAHGRLVHACVFAHQLAVVLVGRHHVGLYALLVGLACQRAYHIVGLVVLHFEARDAVGLQYLLDIGHRQADGLGSLLALRLILRIGFVAEGAARGVESHAQVGGLLLLNDLLQGVHKAQDGRCVLSA